MCYFIKLYGLFILWMAWLIRPNNYNSSFLLYSVKQCFSKGPIITDYNGSVFLFIFFWHIDKPAWLPENAQQPYLEKISIK